MKNFTKILILTFSLCLSATAYCLPKLNSLSGAAATIYLDFDGHRVVHPYWNGGRALNCAPSGLSDAKITEIFHRVSEDFRPFDVNITTDSTTFLAAPLNMRVRVIVTPTSSWSPGVGGISFVGSFKWGDDTPAFVFSDRLSNSAKYIAECCSHESGHTIGLSHQSAYDDNCHLVDTYAQGAGNGEISWAPVMGNSYNRNMTGWNDGPTPYGCEAIQDNLTTITTQNGFGYREDDYSDELNGETLDLGATFSKEGIISTNTDKDAFRYISIKKGAVHLEVKPFGLNNSTDGANLDVQVDMYNQNKELIATFNPANKMNVVIDTIIDAGTYYFVISGSGNQNSSNYGSLGSYSIVGFRGALPIHEIYLTGTIGNGSHNLSWNIIADEPIASQQLELSIDGINFRPVGNQNIRLRSFTYNPTIISTFYYRLKVTTVINETAYSNTVALRSMARTRRITVATNATADIRMRADQSFTYTLFDVNGRLLQSGKGDANTTSIDINKQASGMYILSMQTETGKQIERIIKQ